jgi:hypothetical protein
MAAVRWPCTRLRTRVGNLHDQRPTIRDTRGSIIVQRHRCEQIFQGLQFLGELLEGYGSAVMAMLFPVVLDLTLQPKQYGRVCGIFYYDLNAIHHARHRPPPFLIDGRTAYAMYLVVACAGTWW